MPETLPEISKEPVVDLNPSKKIEFKKSKFITICLVASISILALLGGAYYLGSQSGKSSSVLEKKADKTETKQEDNIKTVGMNEEIEVKSGIAITLESAKINAANEQNKKDQENMYKNSSSQAAYLQSDYFSQSIIDLKVSLTNKNTKAVSYNPSKFRLKDSKDNQYTYNVYEGQGAQIYGLNPNETTKVNLSFTIPEDEKNFKLIYENAIIEFSIK